ncbi:tyrosyl-DNA phosphodiesterase-domain-containing protein [Rhodocollybia butyracea]|uniref:Tyrosyl-DNA phosphodiesterase-domain-containing protein n=1 Tax=Rhodocollybia butyracea TaxID=206335 RepID=A0A9P5QBR7_9AGAR|nr:tyrosyl-DNA phosphodiesterase-domain-containing protein [Rhodocollybia butyracea]
MEKSDDDLARAISLSLLHTDPSIHHSNETEEALFQEQIMQAIQASRSTAQPPAQPSSTNPFLSERAQMEKERRERQKRLRKAKGIPDSEDERTQADSDDEDVKEPSAKRQRLSSSMPNGVQANARSSAASSSGSKHESSQNPYFWDGEWRPTATQGVEPRKDKRPTFRLSEILGNKTEIAFAILSTFALDIQWIYDLFDRSVPVIMVSQPGENGRASVKNVLPNWIKTTPFLQGGYGCMHMKFMMIFYKTGRLRVVVSTANLVPYDWRDIENAAWLQDIPPLSKPVTFDKEDKESFQYIMKTVLDNVNVKPALSIMVQQEHRDLPIQTLEDICTRWDWSKVRVHLIPSIAGKHQGWPDVILTGHTRLMKAVRNMGFQTGKGTQGKKLELEYQASSIGQYTTSWINEFYYSARGESAQDWLVKRKSERDNQPYPINLKILYPTKDTVHGSQHGERGGGTIFCKRNYWEGKKFPRKLFYDAKSKAGNTLMHTKMAIGVVSQNRPTKREVINVDSDSETEDDSDDESQVDSAQDTNAWAYLGSHNFTGSAWGYVSGSAFNPVLNIRNYELGVVFPLKNPAEANKMACFERPPRQYSPKDSPWVQEESVYFAQSNHN